jgi:hypothetical protein
MNQKRIIIGLSALVVCATMSWWLYCGRSHYAYKPPPDHNQRDGASWLIVGDPHLISPWKLRRLITEIAQSDSSETEVYRTREDYLQRELKPSVEAQLGNRNVLLIGRSADLMGSFSSAPRGYVVALPTVHLPKIPVDHVPWRFGLIVTTDKSSSEIVEEWRAWCERRGIGYKIANDLLSKDIIETPRIIRVSGDLLARD